jgi:3-(3-hydroxy-phenyl)propionate hydroxylase
MKIETQTFDLVIAGYGPAGAMAANLLGSKGYRVAIVDRILEIYDKPRAIAADHEVMRALQECGLADKVEPKTVPHPGTYIVGPGNLRRWEMKILPHETPEMFEDGTEVLKAWSSFVDVSAFELLRTAIYRFHALVVEKWHRGRAFLLGDAAHQMPPFLGQGLCAAVRDAYNLVWKIDAVERLGADPSILATYGQERKAHVKTVVAHAKEFGLIIGELDEEVAGQRDARHAALITSGQAETVRQKNHPRPVQRDDLGRCRR